MAKAKMTSSPATAVLELSERRGDAPASASRAGACVPDPEVPAKATRRRFSAEYKVRILREVDAAGGEAGAIGALLRREGLYSTHLSAWRRQRDRGALAALQGRPRGRQPDTARARRERIAELERETTCLQERLRQAEAIIEAQKNLSESLGLPAAMPAARRERS